MRQTNHTGPEPLAVSLNRLVAEWADRTDIPTDCKAALERLVQRASSPLCEEDCEQCGGRGELRVNLKKKPVRCDACGGSGKQGHAELESFALQVTR